MKHAITFLLGLLLGNWSIPAWPQEPYAVSASFQDAAREFGNLVQSEIKAWKPFEFQCGYTRMTNFNVMVSWAPSGIFSDVVAYRGPMIGILFENNAEASRIVHEALKNLAARGVVPVDDAIRKKSSFDSPRIEFTYKGFPIYVSGVTLQCH